VLSGVAGAGKRTLLKHIIMNSTGVRVAVIVDDDVGAINLMKDTGLARKGFQMNVEMPNGCTWCNRTDSDLFVDFRELATLKDVADPSKGRYDAIVVSVTNPAEFAAAFERDVATYTLARLDTMATIVNAATLGKNIGSLAPVHRNHDLEQEPRKDFARRDLVASHVAIADVIVLNKVDLVSTSGLQSARAAIARINSHALVVTTTHANAPLDKMLVTGLFDFQNLMSTTCAAADAPWSATPAGVEAFDVCIVGAGPAGLSVLSALHTPESALSTDSQWRQSGLARVPETPHSRFSVCVIDPSGSWLYEWRGRFKSLGIKMLRSPAFATPDSFSLEALREFAFKAGRQDELFELNMPRKALHMKREAGRGLFHLPGAALFEDFCDQLARKLPHTFLRGAAVDVSKRGSGSGEEYEVTIAGRTEPVRARSIVFALGAAGAPKIPAALSRIHDASVDAPIPRVVHTFAWSKLQAMEFKDKCVVVIGGGLSAAQAALLAVRRGASRVVHASRRPVQSRHFDVPIEWLNPQSGWHVARSKRETSVASKFRMFEFYATAKEERAEWVKSARGGASVPATYFAALEREAKRGRLERCVDEVATTSVCDGGALRVTFSRGTSDVIADCVVLATGSKLEVNAVPLLRDVAARFDLPIIGSLPNIDEDLQWGDENIYVVGAFAQLEMGPDAGNLSGCRRCADRFADNLGAFAMFSEVSAFRTNAYEALFQSDSDSDSDSASSTKSSVTRGPVEEDRVARGETLSPSVPEPALHSFRPRPVPPYVRGLIAQVQEEKTAMKNAVEVLRGMECEMRGSPSVETREARGRRLKAVDAIDAAIGAADVADALCDIKCWTLRVGTCKHFTRVGAFRTQSNSVLFADVMSCTGCDGECNVDSCRGNCDDDCDCCARASAAINAAKDAIASCARAV
jgi:G3E family GTPase/glycine/D-amino acid oxidase-like deaminating enzyme